MALSPPEVPGHHPGADRGQPLDPDAVRRVLVVRADNAGDVVMAGPVVRALRAFAPHAVIDLLASPAGTPVGPLLPGVDEVVTVSASWQQLAPRREPAREEAARERRLVEGLRARCYDTMIVLTSFSQSPWPAAHVGLLAGIRRRVVHSREFGGAVATHWVTPPPDTTHQVDRGLHLLGAVGVPPRGATPALALPPTAVRTAGEVLDRRGRGPFAVLAPGASAPSRRYPAAAFGRVAARVAASGLPVLVAGTPAEAALVGDVVDTAAHPDVTALDPAGLPAFAAVLARASVAITNNSGGMHLAAALGTPVAVAYAGTERTGDMRPRGAPSALLGAPVPCSPCRLLRCPFDRQCLDVEPDRLAEAALRLAGRARTPAPAG